MANSYFNFTQPVVAGTRIASARYNQDLSAVAAAFDALPGSDQLFLSLIGYGPATGSIPNVYNVTIPVGAPLVGYVTGMQITFLADKTSTGAAQVNVNGLGNKSIVSSGSVGLPAGSIIAGSYYTLRYDGSNFQMQTALYALFDTAAQQAATSAASALTNAQFALASSVNAQTYASNAQGSANAAAVSAASALTNAQYANDSAVNALTYASNAQGSASAAANSATTATNRANDAAGSASTATTKANEASASASTATTKASEAAASAQAAANSAAQISLPIGINRGGTGQTTASAALAALGGLPTTGGTINGTLAFSTRAQVGTTINNLGISGSNRALVVPANTTQSVRVVCDTASPVPSAGTFTVNFPVGFATAPAGLVLCNGNGNVANAIFLSVTALGAGGFQGFAATANGTPVTSQIQVNYTAIGVVNT